MILRTILRELLIALGTLLIGFGVVPVVVPLALTGTLAGAEAGLFEFYDALLDPRQAVVVWGIGLAPFALTQLVRLVIWVARILNGLRS